MITIKNLSIGYESVQEVRRNLCAEIKAGELTCLLGLNGTGKSTLIRTICGFQRPLAGEIEVMGVPLKEYSQAKLSTIIGVVLTAKDNAGGLTVRELVSLGRQPHTGFFGRLSKNDVDIVDSAMSAVGISEKADCYVSSLSDGERQRAFIAKALAQECPVIILDEPTAYLDVVGRIEIMQLLHDLAHTQQKAILLSTHDLDLAVQKADTLWIIGGESGMVCGKPSELEDYITKMLYCGLQR